MKIKSVHRFFGGRPYRKVSSGGYFSREPAAEHAQRIRNRGGFARLVRDSRGHWYVYAVERQDAPRVPPTDREGA